IRIIRRAYKRILLSAIIIGFFPPPAIQSPQLLSGESPMGEERRRTPRYPFIATAEVIDQSSRASISTRVSELSLHGCYLDMPNPLPKDAEITIKIYSEGKFFESTGTNLDSDLGIFGQGIRHIQIAAVKAEIAHPRRNAGATIDQSPQP